MGNVPLPSPPKETATRAVCHIVTRTTTGTLQLVPSVDLCVDHLSILGRTDDDVKNKILSLEDRIKRCRAGRFSLAVGMLALVFVVAFAVGLFFKWFWRSFLFDSPLYLIIIVAIELMLGFSANYTEKRETAELMYDIENTIFEEWYEDPNAVRIKVQKVYGTFPTSFRGRGGGQTHSSSPHCCSPPCRGSPNKRQGTFISITFEREDDSESIAGVTRTMDTHSVDQLHV
mmetsp:Transcript_8277/g.13659  ORF Transcript_8277/g.13659 Transcript_8277/m.13659 type:complete len:230 (-) Transcript_8277:305-994(-)